MGAALRIVRRERAGAMRLRREDRALGPMESGLILAGPRPIEHLRKLSESERSILVALGCGLTPEERRELERMERGWDGIESERFTAKQEQGE